MIEVRYYDDFHKLHICFVSSMKDVKFLQDRFGKENVTIT